MLFLPVLTISSPLLNVIVISESGPLTTSNGTKDRLPKSAHSEHESMTSVTPPHSFYTATIFVILALIAPLACISFVKIQQPQVERDAFVNLNIPLEIATIF